MESHWDELLSGKTVRGQFGVLELQDTVEFDFKLSRKEILNQVEVFVISMKPAHFLTTFFVPKVELFLDSVQKKYVQYRGRTPLVIDGEQAKPFDSKIVYENRI